MREILVTVSVVLMGCGGTAPIQATKAIEPVATPETVTVVEFARDGSRRGPVTVPRFVLPEEGWRAALSPLAYAVMREKATELAFTGRYDRHHAQGIYRCTACRTALFSAAAKFDSGTGWPSFWEPIAGENVYTASDGSRDEVRCRRCDSHLGHLFYDGPEPTRLRYCMNSAALAFEATD